MNQEVSERIKQELPLLHRIRALEIMRHPRKTRSAAAIALYVSAIFHKLHDSNDLAIQVAKHEPLHLQVAHAQVIQEDIQAGDLIVLCTEVAPIHYGVLLEKGEIWSYHEKNGLSFTIEPLPQLAERYQAPRARCYRRVREDSQNPFFYKK